MQIKYKTIIFIALVLKTNLKFLSQCHHLGGLQVKEYFLEN